MLCSVAVYFITASMSYKSLYLENRLETIVSKHKVDKYKKKFTQQINTENKIIANISLKNIENEAIPISSVINETKLVYRFTSTSCESCVIQDIEDLKYLGEIIGNDKIIIISSYENVRLLRMFKSREKINFDCYNYRDNFNLSIEDDSIRVSASMFLLDTTNRIKFTYKCDDNPFFNQVYLDRITEYFELEEN